MSLTCINGEMSLTVAVIQKENLKMCWMNYLNLMETIRESREGSCSQGSCRCIF